MDQDKLDGCKLNYMELKKCYKAMRGLPRSPTYLPYRAATRAQIDIYAGAHNRDRALYDKGVANWEAAVMTAFESVEDGAPVYSRLQRPRSSRGFRRTITRMT